MLAVVTTALPAVSDDRTSLERGRGDDAFASIPRIGTHPAAGLRAFVKDGDRTGFDPALVYLNTPTATPSTSL